LDAQIPMREQTGAWRCQPLFGADRLLGRWRPRAPWAQFGLVGCQARAGTGPRPHPRVHPRGDEMKLADVRPSLPTHLPERLRSARRALGGDPAEGQAACHQGRFEPPETHPDVVVRGSVRQDRREATLLTALIDRREQAEGTLIEGPRRPRRPQTPPRPSPGRPGPCGPAPFFPPASPQFWSVAQGPKTRWSRPRCQRAGR